MAPLRILVLGAGGFIGPAVVRRAAAGGRHVVAATRTGARGSSAGETVALDRGDPRAVVQAIRVRGIEAVIDLLAYTRADTLPLLDAIAGEVGRYVMASSGDVYRQYDLLHRKDVGTPLAELAEDAPLRIRPFPYRSDPRRPADAPDAWMDDYDKIPLEQALRQGARLAWCVARLPMVYGLGDRNRRFAWAIGPMAKGEPALQIDEAWAAWRASLGFVDDVAQALVLAAEHPRAAGRIFNVGPAQAATNLQWAQALAEALDWRGALQVVPRHALPERVRGRLGALDLSVPLALATGEIRRALDYAEVTPMADRLAATVAAERALGSR